MSFAHTEERSNKILSFKLQLPVPKKERYLWISSFFLGIILAIVFIPIISASFLRGSLISVFVLGITIIAFLATYLLRRRLLNHRYSIPEKRLLDYQGLRYWLWFAAHVLVWGSITFLGLLLLIALFGGSAITYAIIAGLFAGLFYSVAGLLSFRHISLLGIIWKGVNWDAFPDYWSRVRATISLSARQETAWRQDLTAGNSTYRRMLVVLDRKNRPRTEDSGESPEEIIDLFEQESFWALWRREFVRRVLALAPIVLLTILLSLPIFLLAQALWNQAAMTMASRYMMIEQSTLLQNQAIAENAGQTMAAQEGGAGQSGGEQGQGEPQPGEGGESAEQGQGDQSSGDQGSDQQDSGEQDSGEQDQARNQQQQQNSGENDKQSPDEQNQGDKQEKDDSILDEQKKEGAGAEENPDPGEKDDVGVSKSNQQEENNTKKDVGAPEPPTPQTAKQSISIALPSVAPAQGSEQTLDEIDASFGESNQDYGTPVDLPAAGTPIYQPIQRIPNWILLFIQQFERANE